MDLPPDKVKMLRDFPSDKKWDIIRDRVSDNDIGLTVRARRVLGTSDRQASTAVLHRWAENLHSGCESGAESIDARKSASSASLGL